MKVKNTEKCSDAGLGATASSPPPCFCLLDKHDDILKAESNA